MPSVVSIPPNRNTAAFDASSSSVSERAIAANVVDGSRDASATAPRRACIADAASRITPSPSPSIPSEPCSVALTIRRYQPSSVAVPTGSRPSATIEANVASGAASSAVRSPRPVGARSATSRRASASIRGPTVAATADGRQLGDERRPMATVLLTVEREHARPDDTAGGEARVVDREPLGVAHHLDRRVAADHHPRPEHRHPADRPVLAQPVDDRVVRTCQPLERHRGRIHHPTVRVVRTADGCPPPAEVGTAPVCSRQGAGGRPITAVDPPTPIR